MKIEKGTVWKHYKNQRLYIVTDICLTQYNDVWMDSVIYRSFTTSEQMLFTREKEEFLEKFTKIEGIDKSLYELLPDMPNEMVIKLALETIKPFAKEFVDKQERESINFLMEDNPEYCTYTSKMCRAYAEGAKFLMDHIHKKIQR